MKSVFVCLFIAGTLFDSCGKQCVLPISYQGGTILLPNGQSVPVLTDNTGGGCTVQGYNCDEIKVFGGDGSPLPTYGSN